ncbi:solute carrier family 2, facilitated glucose transporter member 12 isoform X2 [Pristis pectinata]|uniref:solute carrier family 2, facilitated glucose transporter member 12 isoform X2 n=1 Tax=Pristis pectinata TaxID=685728 RepID=UPI00223D77E5|nr:solute carrier family 2, facilitated glucose transporter member 12 isoform X2 [Pristis pectinata]
MNMELELELENESKSTEIQSDFSFAHLNQPTSKKGPFSFILIAASIIASTSGLIFGYELANISGAILQLNIDFQLTCVKQEILVSAILIGGIVGSLAGGYIIDRWERRIGIIVMSSCFTVGSIIMSASTSYTMLVVGRIIVGIATTSGVFSACIYLSEIAPSEKRGMLVALIEFMIVIGVLLAYVINYGFSKISKGWRWMFAINLIPAVLQIIGVFFLPPSPRFMIRKGYDEKASLILQKIRSYSNVDDELTTIKSSLSNESNYTFFDIFRTKDNIRLRVGIGFGLIFFLQASGQPNILYYASTVLRSVGFASDTSATLASVSLGLVKVFGTALAMLLMDRIGRKTFLYIGSTAMIIMLIILAMVVHKIPVQVTDICKDPNRTNHWQDNVTSIIPEYNSTKPRVFASKAHVSSLETRIYSITTQSNVGNTAVANQSSSPFTGSPDKNGDGKEQVSPLLKWLSLACLLLYTAAYSISFGPESIGLMWMLLMYAILSSIGLIFIIFFIPETKSQTLEDISEQLSQGYNIIGACCTMEGVKKLIPERLWKRKGGEHSIWATDIRYNTDGLENYFDDSTL